MRRGLGVGLIFLAGLAPVRDTDTGNFLARVDLKAPELELPGGLSGIDVSDDGGAFIAVGDRGRVIWGELARETDGAMSVEITRVSPLRPLGEGLLRRGAMDAESVARSASGDVYVLLEGLHRLLHLPPGAPPRLIPMPPGIDARIPNEGYEAMTLSADGAPILIPETPERGVFPIYRWEGTAWARIATLPARGRYRVTDVDLGPDGALYILERRVTLLGFRTRIRRLDLAAGEVTPVFTSRPGQAHNLEGLAIWQTQQGDLRALLLSDDNEAPYLRSELIELRLTD